MTPKDIFSKDFESYTKVLFGEERWQRYLTSFSDDAPVSIRLNPFKPTETDLPLADTVPWCRNAWYLSHRPQFTQDPLLHAGAYYVQEAASMFLDTVLQQYIPDTPITMLDLCAAPGGKSTLIRAALPEGSLLMANEPDRRRANILMENLQKQGHPHVIVTNNYPRDYRKAKLTFDAILADVPCSGEGMFRKNRDAITEWSMANVIKCAQLQREIIQDIWPCLRPGGLLIYSTCTFNLREDEENVRWIAEEMGADILPVQIKNEWNITGSLLDGWQHPVYRFIPGTTRGEGLFMAILRKHSDNSLDINPDKITRQAIPDIPSKKNTKQPRHVSCDIAARFPLRILSNGQHPPLQKGKNIIPAHAEALLITLPQDKYPSVELTYQQALQYLHHEAIILPQNTPRGIILVTYHNLSLGFVKNIGNRANNLYPQEWKIRSI